jgi:hypothetical protein
LGTHGAVMHRTTRNAIAAAGTAHTMRDDKLAPALRTRLTLRPGDNGTKKLQAKYGDRLLAVRYRYDPNRQRRLKTVELIEEELPWDIPPRGKRHAPDAVVHIRIAYEEAELRQAVKSAGALWQKDRKLWTLPYRAAQALGLETRIVE